MIRINKNELVKYLQKKFSVRKPGPPGIEQHVSFGPQARRSASRSLQRCGC